ncbi:PREDICTED: uncharacterized protein LOC104727527 [Camelina sativa]|uniref:Uncharacterized protein LOC104727527 n=1 Tax=Camelina sativa TaxID=90675 RepID=A0ABM1QWV5_CAMSA|nr:PREDICTED: uncharacterized protein LOC104727527 [Camelina sativa]
MSLMKKRTRRRKKRRSRKKKRRTKKKTRKKKTRSRKKNRRRKKKSDRKDEEEEGPLPKGRYWQQPMVPHCSGYVLKLEMSWTQLRKHTKGISHAYLGHPRLSQLERKAMVLATSGDDKKVKLWEAPKSQSL